MNDKLIDQLEADADTLSEIFDGSVWYGVSEEREAVTQYGTGNIVRPAVERYVRVDRDAGAIVFNELDRYRDGSYMSSGPPKARTTLRFDAIKGWRTEGEHGR